MPKTLSLISYPNYRRVHYALHALWSKAPHDGGYDKRMWNELQTAIDELARLGLGTPDMDPTKIDVEIMHETPHETPPVIKKSRGKS